MHEHSVETISRWTLMRQNWRSRWWAFQHWAITHVFNLYFCHSCAGYFPQPSPLPEADTAYGKCEACYARDHYVH